VAHLRTQIRTALAARLTGLTTTAARVYTTQLYPLAQSALPGLLIVADGEEVEAMSIGAPPLLARQLNVRVVALVAAVSGHEATLDQIASEVEVALAADRTLGGLTKGAQLRGLRPSFDIEADLPVGRMEMYYLFDYRAFEGAPATPL
jgi:hypothetical protein